MKKTLGKIWEKIRNLFRAWWKKLLIIFFISGLLATGLEFIQYNTQPQSYQEKVTPPEEFVTMDLGTAEISGSTYDGEAVVTEGSGEIIFRGQPEQMNLIVIVFFPCPEEKGQIDVYYAREGESFEDSQFYTVNFWPEQYMIETLVPEDEYASFKIVIEGNVTISSVIHAVAEHERITKPETIQRRRMVKVALLLAVVLVFLTAIHAGKRIRELAVRVKDDLLKDKKDTLIHAGIFLIAAGGAYLLLRIYIPYALEKPLNRISHTFILTVAAAVGCLFCFRKTLAKKAEVFFLIFTLLIGGNIAFFAADTSNISWDDGYHYQQANSWSYFGDKRITRAEDLVLMPGPEQEYDTTKLDAWHAEQDGEYRSGTTGVTSLSLNIASYWSGFSGLGLFIGRALGLPFHMIWELGRFTGLLAYAVIGYYAIRRLKSGKMILAAVLMIPQNLFLAASYSYDPGIVALLALGMAYMFAEWQEPEKKLTGYNAAVMIGSLFMACFVKGVYFPVMLLPLFLPKSKFRDAKHRRTFMGLTVGAMAAAVLLFLLPMLRSSGGVISDTRGGEDVDSAGQIAFILGNPLKYTETLYFFLKSYLHPDHVEDFLTFFAYKGKAPNYSLYLIALAVAAFTDKSELDDSFAEKWWRRVVYLVLLFGTLCLVATSLYISYTPVGYSTINGCQFRYALPLFFPAIMALGFRGTHNKANRTVYNGLLFALIGYVGFVGVFRQFINLYY